MDIDQLLDPQRLAGIWARKTRVLTDAPTRSVVELPVGLDDDGTATRIDIKPAVEPDITPAAPVLFALPKWAAHDERAASMAAAEPVEPNPPPAQHSLEAIEREIAALFAEHTEAYRVAHQIFDPICAASASDGISAEQLDELEELLDALLAANGWPAGSQERDIP